MEFNKYIENAVRTESTIPSVILNKNIIIPILQVFIASGTLLDMLKKNVFYNKPINATEWTRQLDLINDVSLYEMEYGSDTRNNINARENPTDTLQINPHIFHTIVGIATEGTELIEALLSSIESESDIDLVNVREELFDTMWYILIGHNAMNIKLEDTLQIGFDKLRKRYPEKFSSEHAINRDLIAERKILEGVEDVGEKS
ncbi:MAG: hypothetical protein ACXW2E_01060 [Nitrososphaeraceae archaeon]